MVPTGEEPGTESDVSDKRLQLRSGTGGLTLSTKAFLRM